MKSEEFKRIRLKLGYKYPMEFADRLGYSHTSIYDMESGKSPIRKPIAMLMLFLDKASEAELIRVGFYR